MAELIAQGPKPEQHWRRDLPDATPVVVGQAADAWQAPWERWLSRRHVEVVWSGQRLRVRRLETGRNPVHHRGKEATSFDLAPGDFFVIGATTFRLETPRPATTPSEPHQQVYARTIGVQELERLPFRDAPRRLDVLTKLPKVISSAADNRELFEQLTHLLLAGVPRADVVALVAARDGGGVEILHWDRRLPTPGGFDPSRRLVLDAVEHLKDTVLHVWQTTAGSNYTLQGNFDWAFCTPIRGDACPGWGIYVAGRFGDDPRASLLAAIDDNALADDLKFVELVAAILCSLTQVQALERRQTVLGRFFSPGVLRVLHEANAEAALQPRETETSVLFCDLRGFSRKSEEASGNLLGLLDRVSRALGVMTQQILEHQGVVADFLGDAALGFWGWPIADPETVGLACRAALGIRTFYEGLNPRGDHPLAGFRVGIGLATGRAVAGRLGTLEQGKVSVFGPVVNLASRLEGMTKLLHVPILIDEPTAAYVRATVPATVARCRRLARVRPAGMNNAVLVAELLPPADQFPSLTDDHLAHYEAALDAFLQSDWDRAMAELHRLPPTDRGQDLLTGFILRHNRTPPAGWDGVVPLDSKG